MSPRFARGKGSSIVALGGLCLQERGATVPSHLCGARWASLHTPSGAQTPTALPGVHL